ncbi:MAG: GNAT family N-acetyltransferase [Pyrinomonadaceae bacterium]
MPLIKLAETDEEIENCYPVMAELRPHLTSNEFFSQVKRQMSSSEFHLVYLDDDDVKAVAGIRFAEWLAAGKSLEIEDLVSMSGERSKGHGSSLFDWIVNLGKQRECSQLRLVSHVTRFGAHRFYLKKGMNIEAHYFSMTL